MDRLTWLREMRRDCEEQYDTRWAADYGVKWGLYENETHLKFLNEFLILLSPGSQVLDAACGAGRYVPYLLEKGHTVLGIDQSQGMLERARASFPQVRFEKLGLQEMSFREAFDGVICVDAMENVCPEDWLLVLGNFKRALKDSGYLYFNAETFEYADQASIEKAFETGRQEGVPIVYGEVPGEHTYHYHPRNQQVRQWAQQAGFELLSVGSSTESYYHILLRKTGG